MYFLMEVMPMRKKKAVLTYRNMFICSLLILLLSINAEWLG